MICNRIHLTERGEAVSDCIAAFLALVVLPAAGFLLCWALIP
jgi:hypothetical protein